MSVECWRDQCAYDLAVCHCHPKKQVISSIVKTKPPQRSHVTTLAQLSEKCRSDSLPHAWCQTSADPMKGLWVKTAETLVANRNKLLEIIGCSRRQ
jgi:hypothetical protein